MVPAFCVYRDHNPPGSYSPGHAFSVHAFNPGRFSNSIRDTGRAAADQHIHNKHLFGCFIIVHEGQVDSRTGCIC